MQCQDRSGVLQFEIVERISTRMVMDDQHQNHDRQQQKKTAHLRKNDEFYGCISAVFMPPDADQKIHRDNHQFPEKKEQEQVDRQKNADGASQTDQQIKEKETLPVFDFCPGTADRHKAEQDCQDYQEQAEAIHSQVKTNSEAGNPWPVKVVKPDR